VKLITLDFETYYSDDYTLKQLTTEAYIRDPRFEAILLGYKVDDGHTKFVVGGAAIQQVLDSLDIENNAVLCHHAHFDGLILSHHFGHRPRVWFDTLSMARAIHGIDVGGSLGKLLEFYPVGITKGTYLVQAKNKRLADFGDPTCSDDLMHYGRYCCDDVEGTYRIFAWHMLPGFPKSELKQIDKLIRMFTEPELLLDEELLRDYAQTLQVEKLTLLYQAGVTLDEVMSNDKFAEALQRLGVDPPKKISPRTGKPTWAFAKVDPELQALEEHEDDRVQTLVAARLGNKTTINETRARRMADMASRGPACIYYKYAGAMQTMRVSGGDKLNWQNLSRRKRINGSFHGGELRDAIYAPEGKLLVVIDSRNIESRVLDWLAMQEDMVEVYRRYDRREGPDVYCVMASRLYGRDITLSNEEERKTGKHVKLGCGFGMGPPKFKETARIIGGLDLTDAQSEHGVRTYRQAHPMVVQLWNRAQNALGAIAAGPDGDRQLDPRGVLALDKNSIVLPNMLRIKYPDLRYDLDDREWSFAVNSRGLRSKLYGGKIVENVVQALAKIIVMDQLLDVSQKYDWKMSTHDEGVFLADEDAAGDVLKDANAALSIPPAWAPDLPVAAEGTVAVRYGEAK
jgi:DNA polymerase